MRYLKVRFATVTRQNHLAGMACSLLLNASSIRRVAWVRTEAVIYPRCRLLCLRAVELVIVGLVRLTAKTHHGLELGRDGAGGVTKTGQEA